MSGVVRPSAISFGRAERARRPGGDSLRRGQRAARPFQAGTDPDLLWLGREQQQILDRLQSGVLAREGVLLLTGDVGTGKTILAKALLERLRADALIATVTYAQHDPLDFWKGIGEAWGANDSPATAEALSGRLPTLLDDAAARGKRVLLFVDEAQALSQDLLTEIGRLAAMAGEPGRGQARLSILLVGQDELATVVLSRPENAALAKRLGVRCVTMPLTRAEVRAYVAHQLELAGAEGTVLAPVFTDEALRELATASQGIPRLVNTIADLALLSGSQRGVPTIEAEVVRACAFRLRQPLSLADQTGLPWAKAPARMPRARGGRRRVALYASASVLVLLLLVSGGYLYESTRHHPARPEPSVRALPAVAPPPDRPAASVVPDLIQPARTDDAAPSALQNPEPRLPDVPVRPAALWTPQRPVASPEIRPAPAVRQSAPDLTSATEKQRESIAAGAPATPRNQAVTATPAGGARGPREVRGSEVPETDPGGIIDWLLSEYPARRE